MAGIKSLLILCLILSFTGTAFCADVILNEYNAVVSGGYLGGGTLAAGCVGVHLKIGRGGDATLIKEPGPNIPPITIPGVERTPFLPGNQKASAG